MRRTRFITIMLLSVLCIATSSCKKKEILSFGGKMDKFTSSDTDGSKTYLGHAEQWIYWETGDDIKVYAGDDDAICTLVSGSGSLNAFFQSNRELPEGAAVYAIYPASSGGSAYNSLIFPPVQTYRTTGTPTGQDSSFGRGALPMVAYRNADVDTAIYFHAVAGILRIQLFSEAEKEIESIQFKEVGGSHGSTNKQISGAFTVNDMHRNMPYLTGTTVTDQSRTITITSINKEIGPNPNQFLTFYLPLPATGDPYGDNKVHYILEMTVTSTDGYKCVRTLGADIRRRNITMMNALKCTSWTPDGSGSASAVTLVGSGTKDRPFQIYTAEELKLVRDAFNNPVNGEVIINGQVVNGMPASNSDPEQTYFKVVRSDIKLVTQAVYDTMTGIRKQKAVVWDAGINNFKGYMYFASSTATNGGITNESDYPIFQEILATGQVERIFVKGTSSPNVASAFSPLCNTNRGTMIDCHNKCRVTLSVSQPLAGICVNNYGYIQGGANEATLQTPGNVAGICVNNYGTGLIQGNFSISSAIPKGSNVGGICYSNSGSVRYCLVAASTRVEENGNWGIICYNNNSSGIIDNCISTGTLVYTIHGSVGGICNINSGIVRNCSNQVEIRGSSGNVGGIVATMNNSSAEVYNCRSEGVYYIYGAIESNIADNCGGIVGKLESGTISNCYNYCRVDGATNTGSIVGYLVNDPTAIIQNCWSGYDYQFCGLNEGYDAESNTEQPIGDFCFSATVADAKMCNRIVNVATTISSTSYAAFDVVHMLAGQDNQTTYVDRHLSAPLNDWVTTQNASRPADSKYFTWTTTEGQYPRFYTGAKGVQKSRRAAKR